MLQRPDMKLESSPGSQVPLNETEQPTYADVVSQLQAGGRIGLMDLQKLSYVDITCLFEEIKRWLIYGRDSDFIHDPKKLKTECSTPKFRK